MKNVSAMLYMTVISWLMTVGMASVSTARVIGAFENISVSLLIVLHSSAYGAQLPDASSLQIVISIEACNDLLIVLAKQE